MYKLLNNFIFLIQAITFTKIDVSILLWTGIYRDVSTTSFGLVQGHLQICWLVQIFSVIVQKLHLW